MDIENGPIYLALVRYNDDSGQWEASRVEDENNYDDYSKLTKALAEAREELDEAYEKKRDLEGVVEEARKAVAGIDLSRFNIQRVDPESEDAEPSGGTYTEAAQEGFTPTLPAMVQSIPDAVGLTGESLVSQLPVMPVAFLPVDPVVTPSAGLIAESPFVDITLASTERAAQAAETANSLFSLRNAQLPDAMTPEGDSVDLDENKLPGANATPVDEKHKSWWAWLMLAVATLTGWRFLKKKDNEEVDKEKS
ncbi:MAG: hypothetical protein K6E16_04730 [Lachnospiraceae bacterium]|nr:hypothetical protein [Lachnospiraceae bacterium]